METVFARNITIRILDSTAVSIFVVILVQLTNTVFVNSINVTTNIETAVLSIFHSVFLLIVLCLRDQPQICGIG